MTTKMVASLWPLQGVDKHATPQERRDFPLHIKDVQAIGLSVRLAILEEMDKEMSTNFADTFRRIMSCYAEATVEERPVQDDGDEDEVTGEDVKRLLHNKLLRLAKRQDSRCVNVRTFTVVENWDSSLMSYWLERG